MADRLLTSRQGKLGDRSLVTLEPRVVTMYRVVWEYDGTEADYYDASEVASYEPVRRARMKFFRNKGAAYNWMAIRLIFAKRSKLATGIGTKGYPEGCRLCDAEPQGAPDDPRFCRYHGGERFEQLRKRLARWLRWRDGKKEAKRDG